MTFQTSAYFILAKDLASNSQAVCHSGELNGAIYYSPRICNRSSCLRPKVKTSKVSPFITFASMVGVFQYVIHRSKLSESPRMQAKSTHTHSVSFTSAPYTYNESESVEVVSESLQIQQSIEVIQHTEGCWQLCSKSPSLWCLRSCPQA